MVVNDFEEEGMMEQEQEGMMSSTGSHFVHHQSNESLHREVFDNPLLLEEIMSFTKSPISLIILQKTCKLYHSSHFLQCTIMDLFKSNLKQLVSRVGYGELSKQTDTELGYTSVLKPKKCVLSGSIVLQAVLGEEWAGSDIDMYTVASDALRVRHKLYRKMGYLSPVRPYGTGRHTDEMDRLSVYLIAIPGSVLQSVEIWTSTEPKADDLRDAAESLNHARTESFHRSSRSAGMLQVMVKQIQSSIIRHSLRYPLIVTHTPYLLFIMYWEITLFATF